MYAHHLDFTTHFYGRRNPSPSQKRAPSASRSREHNAQWRAEPSVEQSGPTQGSRVAFASRQLDHTPPVLTSSLVVPQLSEGAMLHRLLWDMDDVSVDALYEMLSARDCNAGDGTLMFKSDDTLNSSADFLQRQHNEHYGSHNDNDDGDVAGTDSPAKLSSTSSDEERVIHVDVREDHQGAPVLVHATIVTEFEDRLAALRNSPSSMKR